MLTESNAKIDAGADRQVLEAWSAACRERIDEFEAGFGTGVGDDPWEAQLVGLARQLNRGIRHLAPYREALLRAETCQPSTRPSHFQALVETPGLRLGFLTLFRFSRVPIHDHPGALGVQVVLTGRARVQQYEQLVDERPRGRLARLERRADRLLGPDQGAAYTPKRLNIHELQASTPRCVLLNLVVRPPKPESRTWYFAVDAFGSGPRGLYARVRPGAPSKRAASAEDRPDLREVKR